MTLITEKDIFKGYLRDSSNTEFLKIVARALKDYTKGGKRTLKDFEEEYDCKITYSDDFGGITGITFSDAGGESMFYLRYIK